MGTHEQAPLAMQIILKVHPRLEKQQEKKRIPVTTDKIATIFK